jgi:hypothetical protein
VFVLIAAVVVVFALLRRFGPTLRERAMTRCQEEFGRSSEERALQTVEAESL